MGCMFLKFEIEWHGLGGRLDGGPCMRCTVKCLNIFGYQLDSIVSQCAQQFGQICIAQVSYM
jgi:hypothetical protein